MPLAAEDYLAIVRAAALEQGKLSSSAWFFDGADRLRLRTFGSLAGVVVTVEGRMLDVTGHPVPFSRTHTPNSDRTVATTFFDVGEGFLLNVQIRASTGAPRVGQIFAILEVVRGLETVVESVAVLVQGYVTDTSRLGWPGSPVRSSIAGPGVLRSITGTNPAANTECSETVPANARWRLIAFRVQFVSDGTAATRVVTLVIDDGTTVVHQLSAQTTQTASLTFDYSAGADGFSASASANQLAIPLPPDLVLQGGFRIRTVTTNIQATDNYGAPQLYVEEWIED